MCPTSKVSSSPRRHTSTKALPKGEREGEGGGGRREVRGGGVRGGGCGGGEMWKRR